ncbi:hypothetical protein D0Y65_007105 [Glycine soja]|uniref:Uncharacterized protein n=1 Tax=Glycine soja TaxID=3848 RepID=A0A445LBN2_GLYSO|nr:hypothetical protein D0Y65_007105 [Glycine soja]
MKIIVISQPVYGKLKCNLDAAFFKNMDCIVLACCIRDHAGKMIVARTTCIHPCLSNIDFEMDCKGIMDKLTQVQISQTKKGVKSTQFITTLVRAPWRQVGMLDHVLSNLDQNHHIQRAIVCSNNQSPYMQNAAPS